MRSVWVLFQAIYAMMKHFLGLNRTKPTIIIRYIIIILSALVCIVAILGITSLYFIATLVDLFLRIRHGKKYGGMLKDMDFMMEAKPMGINLLFVIKRNSTYEEYEQSIKQSFQKVYNSCCKLSYEVETVLGYKYYLKSKDKFEDLITVVDTLNLSRENIIEHINNNFMDIGSLLDKKCLRIFIFKQPFKWSKTYEQPEHVVIACFRHSVSSLIPLGCLLEDCWDGFQMLPINKILKKHPIKEQKFAIDDAYVYDKIIDQNYIFRRIDSEDYVTIYAESDIKYIPLIKAIRAKLNVGFTDVLLGCAAAALIVYAEKNGITGKRIKLGSVLLPKDKEILNMEKGRFDYNNISNKIIIPSAAISCHIVHKGLVDVVQECNKTRQEIKGSVKTILDFVITKIVHTLATASGRYTIQGDMGTINLLISNAIGMKKGEINGYVIESLIPFLTYPAGAVFAIGGWSLRGKLQLSMVGSKSVLKCRSDLDGILSDVFKNIETLYAESRCDGIPHLKQNM